MTVAMGFQCSDGVLLCADTELSYGTSGKSQECKIHILSGGGKGPACACVYAGDVDFMKKVLPSLEQAADAEETKIAHRLEREWQTIHRKSRTRFRKGEEFPWIQMLFAIGGKRGPRLYYANGDIFRLEKRCEFIGIGRDVARSWVAPFYPATKPPALQEASFFVIAGLKTAMQFVQGCGGEAQTLLFGVFSGVLEPLEVSNSKELEERFLYLQAKIGPLVASFSEVTSPRFDRALKRFAGNLKTYQKLKYREEARRQRWREREEEKMRRENE